MAVRHWVKWNVQQSECTGVKLQGWEFQPLKVSWEKKVSLQHISLFIIKVLCKYHGRSLLITVILPCGMCPCYVVTAEPHVFHSPANLKLTFKTSVWAVI